MAVKLIRNWLIKCYFFFFSFFIKNETVGPIFIVGTGRSGTHFLCSCLNLFSQVSDKFGGRESPYIFWDISKTAVKGKKLSRHQVGYFHWLQRAVFPKLALDQTHPNLWHVEELLKYFPRAKFIALRRDVRSVIYSMKIHEGTSAWAKNHKNYPKPNRFLGVSENNRELYETKLSSIQRDVFRWCSHMNRIEEIKTKFPSSVLIIEYDELASDMQLAMKKIANFIGINEPTEYKEFFRESLRKNENLTDEENEQIDMALSQYSNLSANYETQKSIPKETKY